MKGTDRILTPLWAFILFSLVIFLLYSNTFQSPFVFDDSQILENYFIRINDLSLENIQNVVNQVKTTRLLLVGVMLLLSIFTWQRDEVWKDKITLWTDVINKAPGSIRGYGNLGEAFLENKEFAKAKNFLLKAIAIGNDDQSGNFALIARTKYLAVAHDNLALAYRKTGNYPEAIHQAEQALELDPKRSEALVTLGITYSKLGRDRKAIEYFSKASTKGLNSIDLYNNWGESCFKLGMLDKAIMLLKHAVELKPDHAESHYNLGIAYSSKGMINEGRKEMSLGIQLRNK